MRLIDADGLRELLDGGYDIDLDELPETKAELLRMIDYQETVDAEPVRHGHWITEKEASERGEIWLWDCCSVCGHCDWDCTESEDFNYCPNCGAKMDGERSEDETD